MSAVTIIPYGMVNVRDPALLRSEAADRRGGLRYAEVAKLSNYDVDNDGKAKPRQGMVAVSVLNSHSGWSEGGFCLFVSNKVLMRLWPDESVTVLTGLLSNAPMAYASCPDGVVYSNDTDSGFISSAGTRSDILLSDTREFKALLPMGHLLSFFSGRVWSAKGQSLFYSDAYSLNMDRRKCEIPFTSAPTLVQPLDAGFYVSDQERVYWCSGIDPTDDKFSKTPVSSEAAVTGGGLTINARYLNDKLGLSGDVAVWYSKRGFCVGDGQGRVINLSKDKVEVLQAERVALSLRKNNGFYQLVAVGQGTSAADNIFTNKTIPVTTLT